MTVPGGDGGRDEMRDQERDSVRDRVWVSGPDTWTFLQSLLSQDVEGMAERERRETLMLTPQGKVDVAAGITRAGDDAVLDTDPGWGGRLAAALERFRIRTDVKLDLEAAPPGAAESETQERKRIEAGVARMGLELDDSVIPQEAFLDLRAVSFTKGCFVGQELVCRIDTRGHVNRYLRRIRPDDSRVRLARGAAVSVDDKVVGAITSSVSGVALGYVRKEVEPPARAIAAGVEVVVEAIRPDAGALT